MALWRPGTLVWNQGFPASRFSDHRYVSDFLDARRQPEKRIPTDSFCMNFSSPKQCYPNLGLRITAMKQRRVPPG